MAHFLFLGFMKKAPQHLQEMVEDVVSSQDCELVGIEMLQRQKAGQLVRIYIDAPGGVGLSHCEAVSRQLGAVLDVEDPIQGEYALEVSSPGMDRPLFTAEHFARFVGSVVRVKLNAAVAGRKNYKGELLKIEGNDFEILVDDETIKLSLDQVDTARIVPVF